MGIIIAKFRKNKTTYEILEKLENEIQSIEEFRRSTEQTQKKMVGRFIIISICVYCLTAVILYFYFFPATAYERIIYIIPLIILPILLILIKRILSWYYNRKIRKNQQKLTNLKDEKKKILEEVMDKETYKVAKTILEKFAPDQAKRNPFPNNENTPIRRTQLGSFNSNLQSQTGLRYRGQFSITAAPQSMSGASATPKFQRSLVPQSTPSLLPKLPQQSLIPSAGPPTLSGTPLLLPRSILPRDRSVLDKMVEYLIGDGPSNRYALICKNCSSHNGMALKEEFDYLSFRCCYCSTFNPARRQRPIAPKLENPLSIKDKSSNASDSEKHSGSDSDSESGEPIVTEPPESQDNIVSDKKSSFSDSERLSDYEIKSSDNESSAMDVDTMSSITAISSQETAGEPGNTSVETKEQD